MAALRIFCCSAPEDKKLVERFRAHLRLLEFQHASIWYTHNALPGTELEKLAAQMDACVATLELYKQKYFKSSLD
jgi:hypothetical protein